MTATPPWTRQGRKHPPRMDGEAPGPQVRRLRFQITTNILKAKTLKTIPLKQYSHSSESRSPRKHEEGVSPTPSPVPQFPQMGETDDLGASGGEDGDDDDGGDGDGHDEDGHDDDGHDEDGHDNQRY